ncbi:hypothetical protein A10D4_12303 [Idiomarina xiamenensis 10-D-4]|uniref:Uncharacterized protein n=2 Tax=Idiomarina xiamenensis TaxID=1207041 RepID=K2JWT9_9GAMM|nr:hypothetical protein A10D4_12303 [Idiomarina xiamenensis 10-D-4]
MLKVFLNGKLVMKKITIVACLAVAIFLAFFIPEQAPNDVSVHESKNNASTISVPLKLGQKQAEITVEPTLKRSTETDDNKVLDNLILTLSAPQGLALDAANRALRQADFNALIDRLANDNSGLEQTLALTETLLDIQTIHNELALTNIACNRQLCAATLAVRNTESIMPFTRELVDSFSQPVSVISQPVVVNGVHKLRLLLNFRSASLVVNE